MSKQDPKVQEDKEVCAVLGKLGNMRRTDAVQGKEIYNYFSDRVIEHTTSKGNISAIKVNGAINRSEGGMMHSTAMHGVYDIVDTKRLARAMVSEHAPGLPLAYVWQRLSAAADQSAIEKQLRTRLARMRASALFPCSTVLPSFLPQPPP